MIILVTLLCAIIIMAVAAITIWLFPTKIAKFVLVGAFVVAIMAIILTISVGAGARIDLQSVAERYDNLMLYYNTVVYSDNEYVRYDYFNKVKAYNEDYEAIIRASESKWTGWFYPAEDIAKLNTIDFTLHGDNFYGEG